MLAVFAFAFAAALFILYCSNWLNVLGLGAVRGIGGKLLLIFSIAVQSFIGLVSGFVTGRGRFDRLLAGGITQQVTFLGLSLVVTFMEIPVKAEAVFAMYIGSAFLNLIVMGRGSLNLRDREVAFSEAKRIAKQQYRLAIPHYATVLTSNAALRADILLLSSTMGPVVVGAYSVAKTAAEFINLIPRAVAPLVTAEVARGVDCNELSPLYKSMVALSGIGIIGCLLLAGPGVFFLFGKEFRETIPFLKILAVASAVSGINGVLAHHLYGKGNSVVRLKSMGIWVSIGVPLMILSARASWPVGIAVANVVGSLAALGILLWGLANSIEVDPLHLLVPNWKDLLNLFSWLKERRRSSGIC
jgi:O-antigen/teichoic acid export membrane protein